MVIGLITYNNVDAMAKWEIQIEMRKIKRWMQSESRQQCVSVINEEMKSDRGSPSI